MRFKPGLPVIAALFVSILLEPAVISAKTRRGAALLVTLLHGRQCRGELIAVKPDGLLLLSADGQVARALLRLPPGLQDLTGGIPPARGRPGLIPTYFIGYETF
jgi:hypothetical protein